MRKLIVTTLVLLLALSFTLYAQPMERRFAEAGSKGMLGGEYSGGGQNKGMFQKKDMDPEMQKMMKQMQELNQEAMELAKEYKEETSQRNKEKIKSKMEGILDKAFDLRLEIGEKGVEKLKDKVAELEESLQKRKSSKDEIIENHLKKLLGEEKHLEW
ncbi:MAG: hypothetical protein ABID32_00010 [Candidatus Omnitrophota bacterium]